MTCSPPSASVLVRGLTLSISQNFIWLSSPAAKKRFWVVSNCTTPFDFFLNPLYVLLMAPSLSFHSTRKDSPFLLVPQENSLEKCGKIERHVNYIVSEKIPITTGCQTYENIFLRLFPNSNLPTSISTVKHCGTAVTWSIIVNSGTHIIIQPCLYFAVNGS